MGGYLWKPIQDLPSDWSRFALPELESLKRIWWERKAQLEHSESLRAFHDRLRREWAIETGIIEGLYTIDRGTTRLLIEKGIEASLIPHGATSKPVDQVVAIVRDQEEVLSGLFDFVGGTRRLSTSYLRQLHQALTAHQESVRAVDGLGRLVEVPLLRGEWKRHSNNPTRPEGDVHEYCPPEQVASELDRLMAMHNDHEALGVSPEVEAAWLHHRFTQIHPFQDGNGRVARALASLVFIKAGWFPLVVTRDEREEYLAALEQADQGDLQPLVTFFGRLEKAAFLQALSLSEQVLEDQSLRSILDSVADKLAARRHAELQRFRGVFEISAQLEEAGALEMGQVEAQLRQRLGEESRTLALSVERSQETTDHFFRRQIIAAARRLGYFADTRTYRSWVRLRIRETSGDQQQMNLVVSFHALGRDFLGVMAASAFVEFRDRGEDGETAVDGPHLACREPFEFTYLEPAAGVVARFRTWVRQAILLGLDQWLRQL